MGGDGLNGLAVVILVACLVLLIVPAALIYWIVQKTAKGKSSSSRALLTFFGIAGGLGIGMLAVTATFFESTWSPPPQLAVKLPKNFKHEWIILLENPSAATTLNWQGYDLPFTSKRTEIDVPSSGVLSLKSLDGLAGAPFTVISSSGEQSIGMGGGPGPKELGATAYLGFVRPGVTQTTMPDPPSGDDDTFVAYIRARGSAIEAHVITPAW